MWGERSAAGSARRTTPTVQGAELAKNECSTQSKGGASGALSKRHSEWPSPDPDLAEDKDN